MSRARGDRPRESSRDRMRGPRDEKRGRDDRGGYRDYDRDRGDRRGPRDDRGRGRDDRGRDDRPRRRSRSRSPKRERRSRSPDGRYGRYSSSPKRVKKKKKSNWDQAPDENAPKDVAGAPTASHFVPGIQVQLPDGTQGNMDEMMGWKQRLSAQQTPAFNSGAGFMHIIRQARRLYVGNLPLGTTQHANDGTSEDDLKAFFNATMVEVQGEGRAIGDSVLSVYINHQRRFGFIEFRTMEEASAAMALDGIMFRGDSLRIGRPANYDPTMLPKESEDTNASAKLDEEKLGKLGIVSNQVTDGPNKIFCGGLPFELGEDQVKELLSTYGRLKSFHLVKDMQTGVSKGFCFFKYQDNSVTSDAIQGLNGIQIGDRTLTVRRHQPKQEFQGVGQPLMGGNFDMLGTDASAILAQAQANAIPEIPSTVLCLKQMVTPEDLKDDEEYADIQLDTREECGNYGTVKNIKIPRPSADATQPDPPGVGKVFVEFTAIEGATKAKEALEGRTFDNKTVMVEYIDLEKFLQGDFSD